MLASVVCAKENLTSRMAAGWSESPQPKAASEGPVVGPAGVLPCLELPTYAAACALVNSRYSCLVAGPHRRHIALSPRYLNRKRTGIREQLDAELLRYSERYQPLCLSLSEWATPERSPYSFFWAREGAADVHPKSVAGKGSMGRSRADHRELSPPVF
jgi:hypothetical protein